MIEVVTMVITRMGVTIQAVGADGCVREEYRPTDHGLLDCHDGNFEAEPTVNQNEDLLEGLCSLMDPADTIFHALNR